MRQTRLSKIMAQKTKKEAGIKSEIIISSSEEQDSPPRMTLQRPQKKLISSMVARKSCPVRTGVKRKYQEITSFIGFDPYDQAQKIESSAQRGWLRVNKKILLRGDPTYFQIKMFQMEEYYQKTLRIFNSKKQVLMKNIPAALKNLPEMLLWTVLGPLTIQTLIKMNMVFYKKKGDFFIPQLYDCICLQYDCSMCTFKWIAHKFGLDMQGFWLLVRGKPQKGFYVPDWKIDQDQQLKAIKELEMFKDVLSSLKRKLNYLIQLYFQHTKICFRFGDIPFGDMDWDQELPEFVTDLFLEPFQADIEIIVFGEPLKSYLEKKDGDVHWPFSQEFEKFLFKRIQNFRPKYQIADMIIE